MTAALHGVVRGLAYVAVVVVVAFLLILFAAGMVTAFIWLAGLLGLHHALGTDTQTSENYASVSGVLPVIVATLGFSGVLVTAWHHLNCHVPGCPRIARYPIAGGKYKVCKVDHEKITGQVTSAEHIKKAHEVHEAPPKTPATRRK